MDILVPLILTTATCVYVVVTYAISCAIARRVLPLSTVWVILFGAVIGVIAAIALGEMLLQLAKVQARPALAVSLLLIGALTGSAFTTWRMNRKREI